MCAPHQRAHTHPRTPTTQHNPQVSSCLVVVEHRGGRVAPPTLNTLAAAGALSSNVTALVGGLNVGSVAQEAAALPGVSKVGWVVGGLLLSCVVLCASCVLLGMGRAQHNRRTAPLLGPCGRQPRP
jgi:hypothetical protein